MLPLTKYVPPIEDVADMDDLPKDLREAIYDTAMEANQYDLVDYSDGDFKLRIYFNYNQKWWHDELRKLLPAEVVERNKFAIYFYQ